MGRAMKLGSAVKLRTRALVCLLILAATVSIFFALRYRKAVLAISQPGASDSLSYDDDWVAWGGDWAASSSEVENNSQERGAKLMSRFGNWGDYQVQADLKMASPYGVAGLIVRSSGEEEGVDSYHGYFAGINPMQGSIEFGRADFGWLPLLRSPLPPTRDNMGWIHLKVLAVGCKFGVAATLPDGRTTSAALEDRNCIRSGRFGLRSYMSSAKWRNIKVTRATLTDLDNFRPADLTKTSDNLFLDVPSDPERLERYVSSIRTEAKRHEIQPGVEPIGDFSVSPGRHSNVTIQGVVISRPPLTAIQDGTGAMVVTHVDPKASLKLGDFVEVQGTVVSDHFRSIMEDSHLKVLWFDAPVPPLLVTASQLTGGTYRGRSIEVEGTLVSATFSAGGYELILQDANQCFKATGAKNFRSDPAELQPGSRIRLKGIATSLSEFTNDLYPFAVVTERIDLVSPPPWWSPVHVAALIVTCVALFVCLQLILHNLQKWHMKSVLREREEMAFEMHDTLAQSFTGIAYQLQAASIERRGPDKVQVHIQNALKMVQSSHREASRTIAALRPQYGDAAGILTALKEGAERLSDGAVRITTTLLGRSVQLPPEMTDALFRIGQEAISNAIQHSGCSEVMISLLLSKGKVQLCVADDGRGFSKQSNGAGLGITCMQTRAVKAKARFNLATGPGAGTKITVTASLPLGHGLLYRLRAMLRRTFVCAIPE
jgi:signal transduction histidine kinase